jgi:hypothetical protein
VQGAKLELADPNTRQSTFCVGTTGQDGRLSARINSSQKLAWLVASSPDHGEFRGRVSVADAEVQIALRAFCHVFVRRSQKLLNHLEARGIRVITLVFAGEDTEVSRRVFASAEGLGGEAQSLGKLPFGEYTVRVMLLGQAVSRFRLKLGGIRCELVLDPATWRTLTRETAYITVGSSGPSQINSARVKVGERWIRFPASGASITFDPDSPLCFAALGHEDRTVDARVVTGTEQNPYRVELEPQSPVMVEMIVDMADVPPSLRPSSLFAYLLDWRAPRAAPPTVPRLQLEERKCTLRGFAGATRLVVHAQRDGACASQSVTLDLFLTGRTRRRLEFRAFECKRCGVAVAQDTSSGRTFALSTKAPGLVAVVPSDWTVTEGTTGRVTLDVRGARVRELLAYTSASAGRHITLMPQRGEEYVERYEIPEVHEREWVLCEVGKYAFYVQCRPHEVIKLDLSKVLSSSKDTRAKDTLLLLCEEQSNPSIVHCITRQATTLPASGPTGFGRIIAQGTLKGARVKLYFDRGTRWEAIAATLSLAEACTVSETSARGKTARTLKIQWDSRPTYIAQTPCHYMRVRPGERFRIAPGMRFVASRLGGAETAAFMAPGDFLVPW